MENGIVGETHEGGKVIVGKVGNHFKKKWYFFPRAQKTSMSGWEFDSVLRVADHAPQSQRTNTESCI